MSAIDKVCDGLDEHGGPAFPHIYVDDGRPAVIASGMTLRDYFAIHAPVESLDLPRMTAGGIEEYLGLRRIYGAELPKGTHEAVHAKARYAFADAMLKERAK